MPILVHGERLEGALNVRTRAPREFSAAEIELLQAIAAQVAQSIEHAKLYAQAQRRVAELEALARISEAVSESLYLEESLEAIVETTMDAVQATGAALVLEDGRIAWPEGRPGAYAVRTPLRWKRRQIGELVADRDTPFTDDERALLEAIAHHAAVALEHGRAVMRGVLAQEIHHRVKNNLQTVASLLRLQARAEGVDPREALEHSVNRILAIAAVHEALTEQRDEEVELAELHRPAAGDDRSGARRRTGRRGASRAVSLAGNRATALALVFSELLQNALEHGQGAVRIELARRDGDVVLAIADEGGGPPATPPPPAPASRSCGRSFATSSRAASSCATTAARAPRWCSRREADGDLVPRARPARPPGESGQPVARPQRRPAAKRETVGVRILVAEDETIIRLDLRDLLVRAGFEVCAEARDGEEAVALARSEQPDLAIMDVKMPRLDGIEAARRILDERPIPIVMLTAYGQEELVSRAVEAGVFGYLVKPFREQDLLPAIQTARARHEELEAVREEAESLAEALAARKVIERAKGLLMEKESLSEEDAFARLRKASQASGRPLRVIAEAVVATLGGEA